MTRPITIAVPKGRVVRVLAPFFKRAGVDTSALELDDRRLIRESADGSLRFLLLKPDDVPTYVEYGTADLGVSGRDVLLERGYDLYQPLDLGVGRCRMVVASPRGASIPALPRVARARRALALVPTALFRRGPLEHGVLHLQQRALRAVRFPERHVLRHSGGSLRASGRVSSHPVAGLLLMDVGAGVGPNKALQQTGPP